MLGAFPIGPVFGDDYLPPDPVEAMRSGKSHPVRSSWVLMPKRGACLLAVFGTYRTKFGALLSAAADRRSVLRVTNEVQRRWRLFSRTGVPGDGWPAYIDPDRAVTVFDHKSHLEFDPHPERRKAWEGFC